MIQLTTPAEVCLHLGIADDRDPRLQTACAAATTWVKNRRSLTAVDVLAADAAVRYGTTLYAALLFQARTDPEGLPGFDGWQPPGGQSSMAQIHRLVGQDVVFA